MTPQELEQAAREAFENASKGYGNATPWDELHEDTRRVYYDWVLRARYADKATTARSES